MTYQNPFLTFAHCWRFAERRAAAEGEVFHVVAGGTPVRCRSVISDREIFTRTDLTPEHIEATADPFLDRSEHAGTE